jgi:hypothetical protein
MTTTWLAANLAWLIPLTVSLLSTLITGLSDFPEAKVEGSKFSRFVRVLRVIVSLFSVVQFRNSAGSLKMVLESPSSPPPNPAPSSPPAAPSGGV